MRDMTDDMYMWHDRFYEEYIPDDDRGIFEKEHDDKLDMIKGLVKNIDLLAKSIEIHKETIDMLCRDLCRAKCRIQTLEDKIK